MGEDKYCRLMFVVRCLNGTVIIIEVVKALNHKESLYVMLNLASKNVIVI